MSKLIRDTKEWRQRLRARATNLCNRDPEAIRKYVETNIALANGVRASRKRKQA